jgi:heme-degrading monooxygenase HmoA
MFIAMNRFKVVKGAEADFEEIWLKRDTHLKETQGFVAFHLLRGPEREDHVLYCSHSVWQTYDAFEAWTKSEQFRKSHAGAKSSKPLYLGPPEFEGFHALQTVSAADGDAVASG